MRKITLTERLILPVVRPSAYFLLRATVYSGFAMIPWSVLTVALVVRDFRLFVTNGWIAVIFVLSVASVRLCAVGSELQVRKELDRGYTSLPRFGNEVDVRDPKDGRLLRVAGQPFRRARTMKLMRERASNQNTLPRAVSIRSDVESSIIRGSGANTDSPSAVAAVSPPRRNRWMWIWGLIVVVAVTFVARQIVFAPRTSLGTVVIEVLIIVLVVGLVLGIPTLLSGRAIQARLVQIQAQNPQALVIPAVRTVPLVGLLSRIAPGVMVRANQVWVFDSAGCGLWPGERAAERIVLIPWPLVQSVEGVLAHSDRGRKFPAVSIRFMNSGDSEEATFFPRRTGALTLFRMRADEVDSIVREIKERLLAAT